MDEHSAFWTPSRYQPPTLANIRAAMARVEVKRMMALAVIGDTCAAEWTDAALNVWIELNANVRGM